MDHGPRTTDDNDGNTLNLSYYLTSRDPSIPYGPEKDSVQETVSSFKEAHLKRLINSGTELRVPIWHSGTREAFLIHVGSAREAIEKKGLL